MPNITAPAALSYSGGMLRGERVVPARLVYSGGNVMSERDTPLSTPAVVPVLDRLRRFDKLVQGETVDVRFQTIWQQTMKAIEDAFVAINARVDEVAILARISAAEALAQTANDNAVAATAAVEVVQAAALETFTIIDPVLGNEFNDAVNTP